MEVTVKEGCISCGLCAEEYPDLFRLNEAGVAEAKGSVPAGQEDQARQAAEECPVGVIEVKG
ncbi:ferredoxin [Evtepia sp.]